MNTVHLKIFLLFLLSLFFRESSCQKSITSEHVVPLKKIVGDRLLNEKDTCNILSLPHKNRHQNVYVSSDECLRLSFALKDSLVNIFQTCLAANFIGDFNTAFKTDSNEILIESSSKFSQDANKLFLTRRKKIETEKRDANQTKNNILLSTDQKSNKLVIDSVYYHRIYWIYIGRKKHVKSYEDFQNLDQKKSISRTSRF